MRSPLRMMKENNGINLPEDYTVSFKIGDITEVAEVVSVPVKFLLTEMFSFDFKSVPIG